MLLADEDDSKLVIQSFSFPQAWQGWFILGFLHLLVPVPEMLPSQIIKLECHFLRGAFRNTLSENNFLPCIHHPLIISSYF